MGNLVSAKFLPFAFTILCCATLLLNASAHDDGQQPTLMNGRCDRNFCACARRRTLTGLEDTDEQLAMECPEWMTDAYRLDHFSDVRRTYCSPPVVVQDVHKFSSPTGGVAKMVGEDMVLCLAYTKFVFGQEDPQPPYIGTTILGNTTCHDLDEYFPDYKNGTFRVSSWKLQDGPDNLLIDYFTLLGLNRTMPSLPSNATGATDFKLEGLGKDPIPICPDVPPAGLPVPPTSGGANSQVLSAHGAMASLCRMMMMVVLSF